MSCQNYPESRIGMNGPVYCQQCGRHEPCRHCDAPCSAEVAAALLERDEAMERIGHAEILLSDLASGYWRAMLNDHDPTGEGIMGERVMQYWAQYSENETSPSVGAKGKANG